MHLKATSFVQLRLYLGRSPAAVFALGRIEVEMITHAMMGWTRVMSYTIAIVSPRQGRSSGNHQTRPTTAEDNCEVVGRRDSDEGGFFRLAEQWTIYLRRVSFQKSRGWVVRYARYYASVMLPRPQLTPRSLPRLPLESDQMRTTLCQAVLAPK